ncbi:MAG: Rieske 2Fe-2S domain-containing protein [Ardenticatenaceae bacterium]
MKDFPEKLFACWHPVAYSSEVTDKPYGSKLLNEHLVIWRTSNGQPHAMKDVCIHRGTALSLGSVVDECIMCPYHGWRCWCTYAGITLSVSRCTYAGIIIMLVC